MKKNQKKCLSYCISETFLDSMEVRSYLMLTHHLTKISRVPPLTDFTERLVPNRYYDFF